MSVVGMKELEGAAGTAAKDINIRLYTLVGSLPSADMKVVGSTVSEGSAGTAAEDIKNK